MNAYADATFCEWCGHKTEGHRCPCTYETQANVQPERRYKVFRENETHGVPYLSEMMARSYAAKFGGTVTEDGLVIASYPVPEWVREIERIAKAIKPARRPGDAEVAA